MITDDMASDPRFNFYPDNYEGGTEFFTLEEDGAYLRLLMLQFRRGEFTEKEAIMKLMQRCPGSPEKAKSIWGAIKDKFETLNGKFWNKRLRLEIEKSRQFSENQAERAKNGWDKRKADADAGALPNDMPETSPNDASNSSSNSIIKTKTNSKKNAASPDLFFSDRIEIIKELNELAGRDFDPHSGNCKKFLNPRIDEYGKTDLIDMIRFMVYKRKGGEFEQYLRPETLFNREKCETYMNEMKAYRSSGKIPKKENVKTLMSAKELFEAAKYARDNKISNL